MVLSRFQIPAGAFRRFWAAVIANHHGWGNEFCSFGGQASLSLSLCQENLRLLGLKIIQDLCILKWAEVCVFWAIVLWLEGGFANHWIDIACPYLSEWCCMMLYDVGQGRAATITSDSAALDVWSSVPQDFLAVSKALLYTAVNVRFPSISQSAISCRILQRSLFLKPASSLTLELATVSRFSQMEKWKYRLQRKPWASGLQWASQTPAHAQPFPNLSYRISCRGYCDLMDWRVSTPKEEALGTSPCGQCVQSSHVSWDLTRPNGHVSFLRCADKMWQVPAGRWCFQLLTKTL